MFIHFHNILDIYYLRTTRFADFQGDYSLYPILVSATFFSINDQSRRL